MLYLFCCAPPAERRDTAMKNILNLCLDFLLAIAASVVANILCSWLNI